MIKIYSKPNCPNCMLTKSLLDRLGAKYENIDVTIDDSAMEHIQKLGYMALPVLEKGRKHMNVSTWTSFVQENIKNFVG